VEGETGYQAITQSSAERLPVRVPGEIHLDLMGAGKMDDPNISDNARTSCRWPEQHAWWYRTEFTVPAAFRQQVRQQLIFEGIDLYGQVFLNGHFLGSTKNAFSTFVFDVKRVLKEGVNELVVRVTSGMELTPAENLSAQAIAEIKNFVADNSLYSMRTGEFHPWVYLRKPDYTAYGEAWCDPLPNIGIWQGVRLEGRSQVILQDVRLDTVIRGQEVSLQGEVTVENLHPWSEIPATLELCLEAPAKAGIVHRLMLDAPVGRSRIPCRIVIPGAKLWWPSGMGEQPLYQLTARVVCGEQETDRRTQTIGLRTIELNRSQLPDGSRFCFKVNGHDVFCKGGNWAPADLIPARIEPQRYEKLVAEAKNAHLTMLRVNGAGVYESESFYDACDRAGILIWQDFMFSGAQYPDHDPEFLAMVRHEAEGVVRRLRHHPSLALWCGNSECQLSMVIYPSWKCDPNRPEDIGGIRIYNQVLPEVCHFYDPARPYWPGSPFGGPTPGTPTPGNTSGDVHGISGTTAQALGQDAQPRMWREIKDQSRARFYSEYDSMGPLNLASVREYLKPEERSLETTAWKIHVDQFESGAVAEGIRYHYGESKALTLEQFVLYGQMVQALEQSDMIEAARFRKGDPQGECQGALAWSYNDTWGAVGWSIIDYYLRRKACFYGFKRAAAPVKALVRSRDGHLVTRVVNDTLDTYRAMVQCGWMRLDGSARELKRHAITIPANGMIEVASVSIPSSTGRNPREWLYAAMLSGEGFAPDQAIWTLAPYRQLALGNPELATTIKDDALLVESSVYCHGVHLEDEGHEILADNYFDLLPGIARRIPITVPATSGAYPIRAVLPIT
jgi:beta-mannosidase